MNPSLYDLLNVGPDAGEPEIRTAWKSAIADLDPTDRRFRAYNQAAEVLLDPGRRAAYDAELAAARAEEEPEPEPVPDEPASWAPPSGDPVPVGAETPGRSVPTWLLLVLGLLTLGLLGTTAYVWTLPSDTAVEESTSEAQRAAERAIGPILSYDYRHLDQDQAAARELMTSDYREDYDNLFEVIKQNAPETKTAITVEVVASGVVRSGTDRAEFLVFLDRPTTNAENRKPVIYKDQVRVQVEKVGEEWLVDCLITTPNGRCD